MFETTRGGLSLPFCAAMTALLSATASAQTVTVNTLDDISDFGGAKRITDLPGPDGLISMREAMDAVNNTPGPQTVAFAIDPSQFWLIQGVGLLRQEGGPFLLTDDETTVDFSTQADAYGDTNPVGHEIGIYGLQPNGWGSPAMLIMGGSHCTIRGLGQVYQRGSSVSIWAGDYNQIVGCITGTIEIDGSFGGPATRFNTIGGTSLEDRNDLYTVEIFCWSDDNVVIGNRIRHVRVEGSQYCVEPSRNRIGGPTVAERNVISGYGYYGEEGFPVGSQVQVTWARDTIVEGNYIGTTADGMARQPQIGPGGVTIVDSVDTTIRNNLIAGLRVNGGNHYSGQVFGDAIAVGAINRNNAGVRIEGNLIGLAADGVTPIPTRRGITVAAGTARQHIADTFISDNTIAAVETYGVLVHSLESAVTISQNSIFGCGALGIELSQNSGADGPTPNDPLDADTAGANRLQNYPVIAAATAATTTRIAGSLGSAASKTYIVEFFASTVCDPSGFGEGEEFLDAITVTTDASGVAVFDELIAATVAPGHFITATATDTTTGDTSEFSMCVAATAAPQLPGDVNADGHVDLTDLATLLTAFGACSGSAAYSGDCDLDASGCVELGDLAVLLTNFGT
ncbi:MAG: hypothetical protein ACKVS9_20215 [Phycisphaerae bacterium]